jgi:hypothetical protein
MNIPVIKKLMKVNSNQWERRAARIEKDLQDTMDDDHPNKIIYKILTDPKDDVIKWTGRTHPDMYQYKVLYPTVGKRILIDQDKNLFPGTSFVVYIPCSSLNECENIKKLMNSKLFVYLETIFNSHRSARDYIMRNLIKPSSFDIEIKEDEDIYRYFNLTKEEIDEIEHTVHPFKGASNDPILNSESKNRTRKHAKPMGTSMNNINLRMKVKNKSIPKTRPPPVRNQSKKIIVKNSTNVSL